MSQRTITGLSPIQDITCESIDISEVITINGAMPTSTMPLGFDATTKTTKYLTNGNYPGDLFVTGEALLYGGVNTGGTQLSCGALNASGNIIKFTNLPTSNPNNAGQLWNNNGTLMVS